MAKKKIKSSSRSSRELFEAMVPDEQMRQQLFDQLSSGDGLLSAGSPFASLLQGAIDSMLAAEADHHIQEQQASDEHTTNKRNGYTTKTVTSDFGNLQINNPRVRDGSFDPQLIGKRQRKLSTGLDEQIIALYAQGNSIEDVRRLVKKLYSVELSAGHISAITEQVWQQINTWRTRPLQAGYAVIYLDAVFFKVRSEGAGPRGKGSHYAQRASYTVYAIDFEGNRDILGIYVQDSEGAAGWGRVLEDLRGRGVEEVFCFCIDGLKGLAAAIREVYPTSLIQRCIVHKVRATTRFVNDRDIKAVRRELRCVYTATTMEQARSAMDAFAQEWESKYPRLVATWLEEWEDLFTYLDSSFPEELRRIIYTTNPVEAVHRILRKLIKGKAAWSSEEALIKQLYLSLQHNQKSWKRKANNWKGVQRALLTYNAGYWSKYLSDAVGA